MYYCNFLKVFSSCEKYWNHLSKVREPGDSHLNNLEKPVCFKYAQSYSVAWPPVINIKRSSTALVICINTELDDFKIPTSFTAAFL